MWGAAPRRRTGSSSIALATGLLALVFVLPAAAASPLPREVWGVAVVRQSSSDPGWSQLARLRDNSLNAVVVNGEAFGARRLRTLRAAASRLHLTVLVTVRPGRTCPGCVETAPSAAAAAKLARAGKTTVVRLSKVAQVRYLRGLHSGRAIAVVQLPDGAAFRPEVWRAAISAARSDSRLDLVVTAAGSRGSTALAAYVKLLRERTAAGEPVPPAAPTAPTGPTAPTAPTPTAPAAPSPTPAGGPTTDITAPTGPTALVVGSKTATSVSVSWAASTDDVGVTGYGLYRAGVGVGTTPSRSYTYVGLACGTTYAFGVDAYDAAGNRSATASVSATTSACSTADSQPPTVPGSFTATGWTVGSISVVWNASLDNVGVSGYGLYRNGSGVGGTGGIAYTFAGLACGTSYTLAVDAYDAAGNHSAKATVTASTSACPPPPSGSANFFVASNGSDSNACTQGSPCRSFDRAYRVAGPGQVVEVAAGTYAAQTINVDSSKTSSTDVVIRPAAGANVLLQCDSLPLMKNCLNVYASHITVVGMHAASATVGGMPHQGGVAIGRGSDDVTFQDIDGGALWIAGSNAKVLGGDFGPAVDEQSYIPGDAAGHYLIDGAKFHDFEMYQNHEECLSADNPVDLTIRNTVFDTCVVYSIGLFAQGGNIPGPVLIENNVFLNTGNTTNNADVALADHGGTCNNVTIRNNTLVTGQVYSYCPGSNVKILGNIFNYQPVCDTTGGHTWDYNVIENHGTACGAHDYVVPDGQVDFVSRAGGDYRLKAGSEAINRASPANFSPTDILGVLRPAGAAPDAGAFESG